MASRLFFIWNHISLKFNLVFFDGGYRLVLESSLTKVWTTEDEPSKPFLNPKSGWLKPNSNPFVVTNGTLLSARPLPYEKQPWCQGMPPSSKSLAAFVTFFLWIYMLIHRMSIYREIKLLGFVIFIYKFSSVFIFLLLE